MKKQLKISTFAIVCVLCTAVAASAASTVRTLGGAGTYNSASSAAAANDSTVRAATRATTNTRSNAVRVNKNTATSGESEVASTSRGAAPSRLSIGKYLGGGTAVSGSTYVRPQGGTTGGESMGPGSATSEALDALQQALASKQDLLTADNAGQYIAIDGDAVISLQYEELAAALAETFGVEPDDFLFQLNGTSLEFKFKDGAWTPMVSVEDIVAAGSNNDLIYTQAEVDALIAGIDFTNLTSQEQLTEVLQAYAKTDAMNTAIQQAIENLNVDQYAVKGSITSEDVVDGTLARVDMDTDVNASLTKADNALFMTAEAAAEMDPDTPYLLKIENGVITAVPIATKYVPDGGGEAGVEPPSDPV